MAIKHAVTKVPGQKVFAVTDWNANHTGTLNHQTEITNVTSDQHHAQIHASSHEIGGGDLVDHANLTNVTANQHHAQSHTIVSHDTTATGGNLTTLTDGSDADALHTHTGANLTDDIFLLNTGDTASGTYNFDDNTLVVNSDTHRVGIGTTNPDAALEIKGAAYSMQIRSTISNDFQGFRLMGADSDYFLNLATNSLIAKRPIDTTGHFEIGVDSSTGEAWTSTGGNILFKTNLAGDYAERMVITDAGDVGIGTITPNAKLDVVGTIKLTEQANADADTAAKGQIWVKTATPNELWFTDDAGTDFQLGVAAGLWEIDGTETQLITADEIDMQTKKIINLVDPTANQEAATKKYVDTQFPVTHASTTGQTTDDHHAQAHTHTHASTTGRTANDHHAQAHTIVSHDTTTTGAQLDSAYAHSIDNTQAHSDYLLNTTDTGDGDYKLYYTIGAADNVRVGLGQYDNSAQAAGVGGQLVLGYKYTDVGAYTVGAIIKMYKENAVTGQYGSGLKFQVRNTGVGLSTKMTLDPSGNLSTTGTLTATGGTSTEWNTAYDASHAQSHTAASHSDVSATGTEINTACDGATAKNSHTHTHASTTGRTANDHHAQSHTGASHSDISSTGANIDDAVSKKHTQNTDSTLASNAVAKDHGTAATDQIINVCYGTGNPPTANTTTIGTLFVKYTA